MPSLTWLATKVVGSSSPIALCVDGIKGKNQRGQAFVLTFLIVWLPSWMAW